MTVWVLMAEGPRDSFVLGVYDDFEKACHAKKHCHRYFEAMSPRSFTIWQTAGCEVNELPTNDMLNRVIDSMKRPE